MKSVPQLGSVWLGVMNSRQAVESSHTLRRCGTDFKSMAVAICTLTRRYAFLNPES
jgi:hypothetical protein